MRFAVLGDLHFTDYEAGPGRTARDRFFEALFQAVAAQKPELILAVGDLVQAGKHSELQGLFEAASQNGIELISITGNHDLAAHPKTELRSYFAGGKSEGPELYHAFSRGGVRFVLLDTSRELVTHTDWSGYVSPEQQSWLENEVAIFQSGLTGDHTLAVLGHHPFYDTTARSTEDMLNIANSAEVRPKLGQVWPGRGFYICGHNHINSLFGPDEAGWVFVQCGAPLVAFSFRLITAGPDGVEVQTLDFARSGEAIQAGMPQIYAGLPHFSEIPVEVAGGRPSDRERVFPVQGQN